MRETEIRKLQEKYWAGESTIQEEQMLRDHYNTHGQEHDAISAIFNYAEKRKSVKYSGDIATPASTNRLFKIRNWMAFAASFIILLAAVWLFNSQTTTSNEIVIEDPEVALQLTQEAFAFLNGKIDESSSSLKDGISHLDKTFIFKNL